MSQRPRSEILESNHKVVTDGKINVKILAVEKSWKTWKRNQKSVMNEELVHNGVMNGKLVKNFVMNAPKLARRL